MDVQAAESDLIEAPRTSWLAREKESGRIYDWATIGSALIARRHAGVQLS